MQIYNLTLNKHSASPSAITRSSVLPLPHPSLPPTPSKSFLPADVMREHGAAITRCSDVGTGAISGPGKEDRGLGSGGCWEDSIKLAVPVCHCYALACRSAITHYAHAARVVWDSLMKANMAALRFGRAIDRGMSKCVLSASINIACKCANEERDREITC